MNHIGVLSFLVLLIVVFGRAVIKAEKSGQWNVATTGQVGFIVILLFVLAGVIDDIRKGI